MRVDGQDFGDLFQRVDEDELTRIVMEVDKVHQGPKQAEAVAHGILKLRDEGNEKDRQHAVNSLHDYFRAWLQYGTTEELRERVEGS